MVSGASYPNQSSGSLQESINGSVETITIPFGYTQVFSVFQLDDSQVVITGTIVATRTVSTAVPTIGVTGNGQPIADGAATASAANDTAFGTTNVGGTTITETYTIANSGTHR